MKYYAIYPNVAGAEAFCYVEAKNIDDLVRIMRERVEKREPYGMFPGWCPEEISKKEMVQILSRFNEKDINLVDKDKRSDFELFARMQTDDAPIIEELKKYKSYRQKYSVNLTEKDIEKIKEK